MRVLVFGDSIAYGEYDNQGGWANRLKTDFFEQHLADLDADTPYVYNLGVGGNTVNDVTARVAAEVEARRSRWDKNPEFILVFAVGINDSVTEGDDRASTPEVFGKDLRALYEVAEKYTDRMIFVGLTPVEDADPRANVYYKSERIQQFDEILRGFAAEKSQRYVPLFETFQADMKEESLYTDGLHPNEQGHRLIYEKVKEALQEVLAARKS